MAIRPRTVRNRLESAGIKPHSPCLTNKLTPHHKRESLAWCRHRRRWRRNQWDNILRSDESRFNVDFYDRPKRVWKRVGERYVSVTTAQYNRYDGGSVLVWAALSYNHKTFLHIVQGNMTALKYCDTVLIHATIQPLVAQTGLTFQDDNARPHRFRIVTDYVQQQRLQNLPWPAISPDLSPIEQLWDELGSRTYERHACIRTRQQMGQA